MSETGDQFTGASERSTKHSPRVDDELEHEMQGRSRAESSDDGDPDVDANPGGTLVGGTQAGMDADAVADAGENLGAVAFDLHPPAAAVPALTAAQLRIERIDVDLEAGGHAVQRHHQRLAM